MGEKEPLNKFVVTHGVCSDCKPKVEKKDYIPDHRVEEIRDLFNEIWSKAQEGKNPSVTKILSQSSRLNIKKVDLLVGLLQPILVKIGEEFERGNISVAKEHMFSEMVQKLIHKISRERKLRKGLDMLIICADGNYHSIGPYILHYFLSERGMKTAIVTPGLPVKEVVELVQKWKPKCLGISIWTPKQAKFILSVKQKLQAEKSQCTIVVGGQGVYKNKSIYFPKDIKVVRDRSIEKVYNSFTKFVQKRE